MRPAPRVIDFPSNPSVGDTVTGPDGTIWRWNGISWSVVGNVGGGGGLASYTYNQSPAAAAWVIAHNMNARFPLVQVVNTATGATVIGDVVYTNVNRIDVTFANPVEGVAIIRR